MILRYGEAHPLTSGHIGEVVGASGLGSESFGRDDECVDRSKNFSIVGYMALEVASQE